MCYWLQGKDLEPIEIEWLVLAMSKFGNDNVKKLISEVTQKYDDEEISIDSFLDISERIPKKLLFQLNCLVLKNLPKQLLWDNVSADGDGDFSVTGELAILKMVCDHNDVDVDDVWTKISGAKFSEAIEYITSNNE